MTPKLADRLSKLVPMLGSDKDGEVHSAVHAIQRSLASEKLDLHDLAERLLSDSSCKSTSDVNDAAAEAAARATASWRGYEARWAARDAERAAEAKRAAEAERVKRAEAYAAEKAAKAAARAAERATPEYKVRVAQRRRDALARRAAEAERAEAERRLADRIAVEGPKWNDIGDAVRRAWASRILRDPSANLGPLARTALEGIECALAPAPTRAMRRGRRHTPDITWKSITAEWIACFEKAARDYAMRHAQGRMCA